MKKGMLFVFLCLLTLTWLFASVSKKKVQEKAKIEYCSHKECERKCKSPCKLEEPECCSKVPH